MRLVVTVFFMFFSLSLFAGEINNQTPAPPPQDDEDGFNFTMGLSAGAAVLDGQLYNQIGIRPLIQAAFHQR